MEWLESAIAILRKVPYLPSVAAAMSGFLLLSNPETLQRIGWHEHRAWLSLVFFIALAIAVAQAIDWLVKTTVAAWRKITATDQVLERLRATTPAEREVLVEFLAQNNRTIELDPDYCPGIPSLERAGIITRQIGGRSRFRMYAISERAWSHINAIPGLVH